MRMKPSRRISLQLAALCLAFSMVTPAAAQGLNYNALEHVDHGYLSEVAAVSGTMAFTNIEISDLSPGHPAHRYMLTFFYDVAAPVVIGYVGVEATFAGYEGAFGAYMYDMTAGIQAGERFFASATSDSNSVTLYDYDFSWIGGPGMDLIVFTTENGYTLSIGEQADGLANLIDLKGKTETTLGDSGFPLTMTDGSERMTRVEVGSEIYEGGDAIYGNGMVIDHFTPAPEPSGALLLGLAGLLAVIRRRRTG